MLNIKEIRTDTGLSQKEFGLELGLTSQTITKYESGKNVPESIQKLIRYVFSEYLPETERIQTSSDRLAEEMSYERIEEVGELEDKIESLRNDFFRLEKDYNHAKEKLKFQNKTIKAMEDQIELYKNQLGLNDKSKTA